MRVGGPARSAPHLRLGHRPRSVLLPALHSPQSAGCVRLAWRWPGGADKRRRQHRQQPGQHAPRLCQPLLSPRDACPGSHTLQARSCGTVPKLPRRPDSQARPQIFRLGLLKQGKHFLCALHCVSGDNSQLIHTQLEVTFPNRHVSTLAHDRSQAGRRTRQNRCHTTQPPTN